MEMTEERSYWKIFIGIFTSRTEGGLKKQIETTKKTVARAEEAIQKTKATIDGENGWFRLTEEESSANLD